MPLELQLLQLKAMFTMGAEAEDYEETFANPYIAAGRGYVDDVIRPSETRTRLIAGLEALATKRDTNPRKKHGNIPL